jgi:hypothetical protein
VKDLVARRVDRLLGSDGIGIAQAIAVGIENKSCPTLRSLIVAGLVIRRGIKPADDRSGIVWAPGGKPDRMGSVLREV